MLRFMLLNFFFQATVAVVAPYTQIVFRNKGYSHSLVGAVIAMGQVASIIFPIFMAMISDRTRKTRLMVMLMMFGSVALLIPSALSGSLVLTLLFFIIASSFYWSLNPMLDGYQSRLLRGNASAYGIARAMGTLGYVVALLVFGLTGFPDETSNRSICLCLLIVAAVFLVVMSGSPRDVPPEYSKESSKKRAFSFSWFSGKYYLMILIVALSRIAHAVPEKLLASYMTEDLGFGGSFTLFIALGAFSEFLMMMFGGKLLQNGKATPFLFVLLASVGLAVRLMIYYLFRSVWAFTFAQLFHSLTFGALHIGMAKFIAQNVEKEHYSLAMSVYWAIGTNLPSTIGVLLGGFVIDSLGYPSLFAIYTVFPIIAVILCIIFRSKLRD